MVFIPCSPQERSTAVAPSAALPPVQGALPESELQVEVEDIGQEEPTTVEGPTWDDSKQLSVTESWPLTDVSTEVAEEEMLPVANLESHPAPVEPPPKSMEHVGDVKPEPSTPVTVTTSSPLNRPQGIATPSPKLSSRPAVSSHRSSARHKVTDQPVTLPLSFGATIEKVGMQFGSLNVEDASATETDQYV